MRFFHISDLHLGMRVNGFSMIEDQQYILAEIVWLAKENKPDAVLIAGDVYDKSVPSIEAVQLLDKFLVWLNELGVAVYLISGNHDSAERVSFAASLLGMNNIHISQAYNGILTPFSMADEYGQVNVWMLPYIRPSAVRPFFHDNEITAHTDAVAAALSSIEIETASRNILIAHQFVTGAVRSESEEIYVGGTENVDASLFFAFDYVALGHLHRPQRVMRETLRYCGSPLKYSLSEVDHTKSITMVDMGTKGDIAISEIPLIPRRDVREIRGNYTEVTSLKSYANTNIDDYVYIVLTDEDIDPDAKAKLQSIYPKILNLRYDNKRTQTDNSVLTIASYDAKEPVDLLGELYETQNGQQMSPAQKDYARQLLEKVWEGNP